MSQDNTAAIEAFIAHKGNAENLLDAIKAKVKDHLDTNPEEINWGHTGSMAHVSEQLQIIAEHIGLDTSSLLNS